MSVWTFIKLLAALGVMVVLGMTSMLAYHVAVRPLDGSLGRVFERFVPSPRAVAGEPSDMDFVRMVEAAEMPDIDPGERLHQKALELIAVGDLAAAREKLTTIINVFPTSSCAGEARRIVGQMNLDEILSSAHRPGKQTHVIKRGESYLGIAAQFRTTLDCIYYFNATDGLKTLQPGEELTVMPLDYRLVVEPQRMTLALWDGGKFVCEYPIRRLGTTGRLANQTATIQAKPGHLDSRATRAPVAQKKPPTTVKKPPAPAREGPEHPPDPKDPPAAVAAPPAPPRKALQLNKAPLRIGPFHPEDGEAPGIFLAPEDFEELFLLTRVGNTVEIRNPAK
jgi:hypothetical protein